MAVKRYDAECRSRLEHDEQQAEHQQRRYRQRCHVQRIAQPAHRSGRDRAIGHQDVSMTPAGRSIHVNLLCRYIQLVMDAVFLLHSA